MYNSKDDFHFRTAGGNGVIRTLTGTPGDPPPGIQTGSTGRPTRPDEVCRAILYTVEPLYSDALNNNNLSLHISFFNSTFCFILCLCLCKNNLHTKNSLQQYFVIMIPFTINKTVKINLCTWITDKTQILLSDRRLQLI